MMYSIIYRKKIIKIIKIYAIIKVDIKIRSNTLLSYMQIFFLSLFSLFSREQIDVGQLSSHRW